MRTGSSETPIALAGNLDKPLLSLYGTEWRERGYGLRENKALKCHVSSFTSGSKFLVGRQKNNLFMVIAQLKHLLKNSSELSYYKYKQIQIQIIYFLQFQAIQ
jgi:hypothetical protein